MNKALDMLDRKEDTRQKAAEHPEQYPVDYTVRLCCAIVVQSYGYQNRKEWTDSLKEAPEGRYTRRLSENRFHI